jgi:hypothetical protein
LLLIKSKSDCANSQRENSSSTIRKHKGNCDLIIQHCPIEKSAPTNEKQASFFIRAQLIFVYGAKQESLFVSSALMINCRRAALGKHNSAPRANSQAP